MICYCFLVKDEIIREDIWQDYFNNHEDDYKILIHAYGDEFRSKLDYTRIPTVETSWQQTVKAHFAFYEAFLQTECKYMALLSESDVPVKYPQSVASIIKRHNGRLFTYLSKHPDKKYQRFWDVGHRFRAASHIKDVKSAEQWYVVNRDDVKRIVEHKNDILNELKRCGADNEMMLTYYYRYINDFTHDEGRYWYIKWPSRGAHPFELDTLNWSNVPNESIFARKVNKNTKITKQHMNKNMENYRCALHLHVYHNRVAVSMYQNVVELKQLVPNLDIYLTYSQLTPPNHRLFSELGDITFIKVPNKGFDVYPFLHILDKLQGYDWVWKWHTKKVDKWRKKLIEDTSKIQNINDYEESVMLGSRRWSTNKLYKNGHKLGQLQDMFGIPKFTSQQDVKEFCAGTFFIVNKYYIEDLFNKLNESGVDLEEMFNHPLNSDGTWSHAWERFFPYFAKKYIKQ